MIRRGATTQAAEVSFAEWAKVALVPLSGTTGPGAIDKAARCGDAYPRVHASAGFSSRDIASVGRVIGDAPVVALGEGDHFAAEPLELRNQLFEYLVREKGFTAIAIESGVVESRVVNDYVLGGDGELGDVLARGISWTFDELPQNAALVRWIRDYNATAAGTRKIQFYGFDVPGSPGNPQARRGVDTALLEALRFLARVEPEQAEAFRARVEGVLPNLRFDRFAPPESPGYPGLSVAQRDALTATIADLVALVEAREARYTEASSPADYAWALRAAVGARQLDGWLRQIPVDWCGSDHQFRFLDAAGDVRDRAQAENVEWIVAREGAAGKVLLYAHNLHLCTRPCRWHWQSLSPASDTSIEPEVALHEVAGTYLRRRLGDRLFVIGNLIGEGEIGGGGSVALNTVPEPARARCRLAPAAAESLDGIARSLGEPRFLLDLRHAPADVAAWLHRGRRVGHGFGMRDRYRVSCELAPGAAFDALLFLETVRPACG